MSYPITPALLAEFNKMNLTLSGKAVREFRQRHALPTQSDKQLNVESIEIEMVETVPDIEVSDYNGLIAMVILEPLDSAQHPELFDVSKKVPAKKTPSKSVRGKAKSVRGTNKGTKHKNYRFRLHSLHYFSS